MLIRHANVAIIDVYHRAGNDNDSIVPLNYTHENDEGRHGVKHA